MYLLHDLLVVVDLEGVAVLGQRVDLLTLEAAQVDDLVQRRELLIVH